MKQSTDTSNELTPMARLYLESVTDSILRDAHDAAARRGRHGGELSQTDILEGLANRKAASRRRVQLAFAGPACAGIAIVSVLAIALILINQTKATPGQGSLTHDLIVTTLLLTVSFSGSTLLMLSLRESTRDGKVRDFLSRWSSRQEDEAAMLGEWSTFEKMLASDLPTVGPDWGAPNLARRLSQFSQLYDYDYDRLREILGVRNAIAYGDQVPTNRLRKSLAELRRLTNGLRLAADNTGPSIA